MTVHSVSGSVHGFGTAYAQTQNILLVSGLAHGSGDVEGSLTTDVSGTVSGSTTVNGQLVKALLVSGFVEGQGTIELSVPEPIVGVGTIVGYLDLVQILCPVCGCCPCRTHHRRMRKHHRPLRPKC